MLHNAYGATVFLLLAGGLLITIASARDTCKVGATVPWSGSSSQTLLVPLASTVVLNCTLASSSNPLWSVDLAGDSTPVRFQFNTHSETLNRHGVYELPNVTDYETGMITLRLLINDTAGNNQTLIDCAGRLGESFLTTLFVFEPKEHLVLIGKAVEVSTINLTWSNEELVSVPSVVDVMHAFTLNISHGSSSQIISVNASYYHFTAPEGAPPCEVYNFSFTATYVGATYTGAGCSVPSPVISTMLPSLPNISQLESSIHYSLMKEGKEEIFILSFEEVSVCEQYPVLNYTLVMNSPSYGEERQLVSPGLQEENRLVVQQNTLYSFKILATNAAGAVSTEHSKPVYTTDVQMVSALPMKHQRAFHVHCEFIEGSDAQGCMIVFVGMYDNETAIITRRNQSSDSAKATINVPEPATCYHEVYAFDIEHDGGVGTLEVPGRLSPVGDTSMEPPECELNSSKPSASVAVVLSVASMVVVVLVAIVLIIIIIRFKAYNACWHRISDIQVRGTDVEKVKVQEEIELQFSLENKKRASIEIEVGSSISDHEELT